MRIGPFHTLAFTAVALFLATPAAHAGDGAFPAEPSGSPYGGGKGLAVGDFNSDANPDMVTCTYSLTSSTVEVRLGVGDGSLPVDASTSFQVPGFCRAYAVGDLNGDGHEDIAAISTTNGPFDTMLTIRLGSGAGTFSEAAGSPYDVGMSASSLAIADFNSDGAEDVAIPEPNAGHIVIRPGTGTGAFPDGMATTIGAGSGAGAIVVGDFNSDGHEDLAVTNFFDSSVTIRLGAGNGTFPDPVSSTIPAGVNPVGVAIGDFNNDGNDDLVNSFNGGVKLRVGLGDGTFGPVSDLQPGKTPVAFGVGDFNSDGNEDLAVVDANGHQDVDKRNVRILLGAGDGSFPAESPGAPTAMFPDEIAVSDFDSDGNQDLAVAAIGRGVTVRLGSGPALLTGNLLQNGGAEGPGAASDAVASPPPPAWSVSGRLSFVRYTNPGFPKRYEAARWEGGENFFAGGPANASSSAVQTVDISASAISIDAGLASATLQADLGGFRHTNDSMTVTARLLDAAGAELGSFQIGPVAAADRRNITQLLRRSATQVLPTRTRHIEVTMAATRTDGAYNDGYADNVKLTLDIAAPPADSDPPGLTLSGLRRQRLDEAIEVKASCDEVCDAAGKGKLVVTAPPSGDGRGAAKGKRRRFRLRTASISLESGRRGTLKLRLTRKARQAVAGALEGGGSALARVTVSASDAAGNTVSAKRTIRLSLPGRGRR